MEEVEEVFASVPIYRPYGRVGELPGPGKHTGVVHFGSEDSRKILLAANSIRTFTEDLEDLEFLAGMRTQLSESERIIFLGSAFHRQNMELLRCRVPSSCKVMATVGSMSESDVNVVKREISGILEIRGGASQLDARMTFSPVYCKEFFSRHWRTLTA